ncbi:MAG: polyribonucleotide nucleotidyltransferase [Synergistaceae bacterium]|nr:polyribonucleotide nucleotidyltransferase [Synergistaceae bacterium]
MVGEEPLIFRTGKLAKQANGAVVASQGDTVILSTTCMSDEVRTGIDFFPLIVDYEEKYYAAGKIPGGFVKREGKPADSGILGSRVVDRAIRSLFSDDMRNEVQIVNTILAVDQVYPPNVLAINASSASLAISGVPWGGPVGAVRIGLVGGNLIVNPTDKQMNNSLLNLIVAGHDDGITMVESGSYEVSEELLVDALELAHSEIKKIIAVIRQMKAEIGKPLIEVPEPEKFPEIEDWIRENCDSEIDKAVRIVEKKPREKSFKAIKTAAQEHFAELIKEDPDKAEYISSYIDERVKTIMRGIIINERIRVDGRKMDQIRQITCETGILPRVHGSALFTRGETQSLATATLGMIGEDDQLQDGIKLNEPAKRFILHYNFPPFSVGEIKPMRGPGRREIGHGALAERALLPVIPTEEEFPYVIRIVSDILESNGSSSQASICGGSLSMMHAGVPIRCHVAGIAMGLIKEGDKVQILTDIQGLEDHYGDMDFKVAGTRAGVTALQMDNKAGGITREILEQALSQARKARFEILEKMENAIPIPNKLSPDAPRIISFEIDPDKIREVIGSGGKVVRSITQRTGVKMNIEDNGIISISGPTQAQVEDARSIVLSLIRDLTVGEVYYGTVTRLLSFGAFVECLPGKEGLLHVSEISTNRVPRVEDVLKPGDRVLVMVKDIDEQGRANLTRRRVLASEDKIRSAGLMHVLPDERERENLISSLSSRERGYSNFSMRDRLGSGAGYMERGFSRGGRSDFDFGGRGGYSSDRRNDRRNDRRRDYR